MKRDERVIMHRDLAGTQNGYMSQTLTKSMATVIEQGAWYWSQQCAWVPAVWPATSVEQKMHPDDGADTFLRNARNHLLDYMASKFRRPQYTKTFGS
jgi:hypothetical protein